MEKYEAKIRRNKKKKKRKTVVISVTLLILLFLGFFVGSKISQKRNVVVSAANNSVTNRQKKSNDEIMDNRESRVTNGNISNGSSFNPYKSDGRKIAYLTFDDGPSANITPKILDILESYNIEATFFLIGKNAEKNSELVKREAADGNLIGNHSYSHNMNYIYSNPDVFISDVNKCDQVIKSILGNNYNSKLLRFPGGSFGKRLAPFRDAAKKDGYNYVDWNDLTGDAEHNNVPVNNLLSELKKYTTQDHVVILMHDASTKQTTVQALPEVIDYLKSQGYSFDTLK